MAEKQIIDGDIGPETKYDVDFVDGKVRAEIKYDGKQANVGMLVELELVAILKVAAAKTDNKIDDSIVSMVEAALS